MRPTPFVRLKMCLHLSEQWHISAIGCPHSLRGNLQIISSHELSWQDCPFTSAVQKAAGPPSMDLHLQKDRAVCCGHPLVLFPLSSSFGNLFPTPIDGSHLPNNFRFTLLCWNLRVRHL